MTSIHEYQLLLFENSEKQIQREKLKRLIKQEPCQKDKKRNDKNVRTSIH